MPIFRTRGAVHVFAHVPKCAGTSIEEHLAARFGPMGLMGTVPGFGVSLQHLTWVQIEAVLPPAWIAGSFAVVRHPLDRFVSGYNMRLVQATPPFPREVTITDFLDWAEARLPSHPTLLDNHLRPQTDFIGPDTNCFRFEDGLDAVIAYLDAVFGPQPGLPPLGHHDYRDRATEQLFDTVDHLPAGVVERVAQLYAGDFARFGYDTSPDRPVKLRILKPEHAVSARRKMWLAKTWVGQALARRGSAA